MHKASLFAGYFGPQIAFPIFGAELLPGAVFNNKLSLKCMSTAQAR